MIHLLTTTALSLTLFRPRLGSVVRPVGTVLTRQPNGNVVVESLAQPWQPVLERQPDGTIQVLSSTFIPEVLTGDFGELFAAYFSSFTGGLTPEALRSNATPEQKAKIFYEVPPPPRIAPVEPNTSVDLFGDPIFSSMTSSDNDRTLDDALDYRLEGNHPTNPLKHAVSGGVFYSNFSKLTGGRRVLLRRWDTMGYPFTVSRPVDCTVEGFRGDYTTTPDADFMLFNGQPDINKPKSVFRIARHTSKGQHGNNADGYKRLNSPNFMPVAGDPSSSKLLTPVTTIEHGTDGLSKITLTTAFPDKLDSAGAALSPARNVLGSVPTLPDFFIINNSSTAGQVRPLDDANWRFDILSFFTNSAAGTITTTGNYNAPVYTLSGTFSAGERIELFIAGTRFTYTVVGGSTSTSAITTALRSLVAADGRFTSSTAVSNILTVVSSGLATSTVFWGKADSGHNVVNGTTATGGTAWWFTQYLIPGITTSANRTPGTHADGAQWAQATGSSQPIYQAYVMIDQCTWEGNYGSLVVANSASSDTPLQFTRSNYRWKSTPADDISSGNFRVGHTNGVGIFEKRIYEVYNEPRPRDTVASGIGVTVNGKDANNIPDATFAISNGLEIAYTSARPEIKGVFKRGLPPGGDFSPYASNGGNYVHPGYSDFDPTTGTITDITFTGLTSINESTLANGEIGLFDVATTNKGGDIDLSVVSTNVSTKNWYLHARRLVNGVTRYNFDSTPVVNGTRKATLTVRATIRDSNPLVTFDKTFEWPIIDDVAPATSALTVTNLASSQVPAPTSGTNVVSVNTGTASTGRRVVYFVTALVATASRELPTTIPVTGATGGNATRLLRRRTPLGSNPTANIALTGAYIARMDTGTTADVSVSVGGSFSALGVSAVAISNLLSDVPFSSASAENNVSGGAVQFEIDVPANGIVTVGAYYSTPTSGNKYHATLVFSRNVAGTYIVRGTVTAGSAGPIVWEMVTSGAGTIGSPYVWTVIDTGFAGFISKHDTKIEDSGSGATTVVAVSFGNGFV